MPVFPVIEAMVTVDEGNWYFLQILLVVNALKITVDSFAVFGDAELEKRRILPNRRMYGVKAPQSLCSYSTTNR